VPLIFTKKSNLRYFVKLAYNGTNYHGWQCQPNASSIQETLNNAFSIIFNVEINIMGAGRTDTGVHAQEMFAHFDFESNFDIQNSIHKLNSFLPKDIVIFDIIPVHDEAHARFDATQRTYEYHINTVKNVFQTDGSWYYHQNLNIELMNLAAAELKNYTDFECFSKVNNDVNNFNCVISEAFWNKENDQLIFTISADRFLRNMVRAIVGTLINIGLEKITLEDFKSIIECKDRNKAGFSVPAHGLYLTRISYDYI
jgi:tRNA pseudouridine38-40 synthase